MPKTKQNKVKQKFVTMEREMSDFFLERKSQIRGILVALLAEENVLFIAPPGTSKSLMVRNLSDRIISDTEEDYFEWLMTKFTKPEEILGPMIIDKLVEGIVEYNPDYKLPRARIAYLDEIFKCNSSMLNCLLSALNEKIVYNANKPTPIPLQMLVGTSNEIPQDESLKALYDRFRLRYTADYIKEPGNLMKLLDKNPKEIPSEGKLTMADIDEARIQINKYILFPVEKQKILTRIVYSLSEAGFRPSDRTINKVGIIIKSEAWMNGHDSVDEYDMEILENVFWDEPKSKKEIRSIIFSIINPLGEDVLLIYEKSHQAYLQFIKDHKMADKEKRRSLISETCGTMNTLCEDMERKIKSMEKDGRPTGRYESLAEAVMLLIAEIKTEYIGIGA